MQTHFPCPLIIAGIMRTVHRHCADVQTRAVSRLLFALLLGIVHCPLLIGCCVCCVVDSAVVQTTKFMNDPVRILVKRDELTLEGIKQFFVAVEKEVSVMCPVLAILRCQVLLVEWRLYAEVLLHRASLVLPFPASPVLLSNDSACFVLPSCWFLVFV